MTGEWSRTRREALHRSRVVFTVAARMRRFLTGALALMAFALLPACATPSGAGSSQGELRLSGQHLPGLATELESSSGLSPTRTSWPDPETLEQARRAEAERALETLWSTVSTTHALGAEWEARFWSDQGALTLLSLQRTEQGEEPTAPISRGAFLPRLSRELPTLLGTSPKEVTLTLEREETGWSADLDTSTRDTPPAQARQLPSTRRGAPEHNFQQVLETARRIARLMVVPQGGSTRLTLELSLEDPRIQSWEPEEVDTSGGGQELAASEAEVSLLVRALLPFTEGLGERTVLLRLEGEHRPGDSRPRWSLVEARTLEPPSPPPQVADFHKEYRALHEYIILEFQEQASEEAIRAASFSLEQVALAIVGGFLIKRAAVLVEVAAPRVVAFLAQGGTSAVRWFRNLLVRAPPADRELLRQLWMKVETQGLHSLTTSEKQQLRAVMGRLDKLLDTPLDATAKKRLWEWSREEYFELHNPQFARVLGKNIGEYEVHHLCPMQYAHLFPKLDINGKVNLVGVHRDVHRSITTAWNSLRSVSTHMKSQDVDRAVEIVNRHYGRWFERVFDPKRDSSALIKANQAAMGELTELKAMLTP
jgi:hypothetical protein